MNYFMLAENANGITKFVFLPNLYTFLSDLWGGGKDFTVNAVLYVVGVFLCILIPYLLGSINPAIILSRKVYHDDIRTHGSGNAGTTNTLRTYGKKTAIAVFALDFLKAAVSVILCSLILPYEMGGAIAGLFVIVGHMFPIYYKFKGGKGVACLVAVAILLSPLSFCIVFPLFIVIVLLTRYVSLASVMSVFLLPLIHNALHVRTLGNFAAGWITLSFIMIMILVVFQHRTNIKRLMSGTESKVSFGLGAKKEKEAQKAKKDSEDDNA